MIKVQGRSLLIQQQDKVIGWQGDHLVEVRQFEVQRHYGGVDLAEVDFKLDTEIGGSKNIIDLAKEVREDEIVLTWTIRDAHILTPGRMNIQLRAFRGTEEKWHSAKAIVSIQESIQASSVQPDPLPSEFVEMEARVTAMKGQAEEGAQTATEQADIATVKAQEASESADSAAQSAQAAHESEVKAKVSEVNAKESEVNAGESESVASQTMADLLAMLGTHVATLGPDGKLSPSQIPPISINDTYPVANIEEMLQLVAERGDCAVIMENDLVTDSYILADDDPSKLESWVKLGISYVAEAGHAQTATAAESAYRINGHRMVAMAQEQYDQAVKDPETIYLVEV